MTISPRPHLVRRRARRRLGDLPAHRGWVRPGLEHRRVIPDARSVREALGVLRALRGVQGHRFWPDDVSVAACPEVALDDLQGYRQVTDALLLALAARNGGTLVTFDRGVADLAQANAIQVALLRL